MCDTDNSGILSASAHLVSIQEGSYDVVSAVVASTIQTTVDTLAATAITSPTNSVHGMNKITSPLSQQQPSVVLLDDIASENYWLREKMKEIATDRDRLLCEVANLRLELDMAELKRLPEDR